jgi:hypothetical protein
VHPFAFSRRNAIYVTKSEAVNELDFYGRRDYSENAPETLQKRLDRGVPHRPEYESLIRDLHGLGSISAEEVPARADRYLWRRSLHDRYPVQAAFDEPRESLCLKSLPKGLQTIPGVDQTGKADLGEDVDERGVA